MRLTDNPRTLAEVKPDGDWPAALQATLDKALARSADERYQSAAQFGREFAAAIADMPMTRAIEAGTQVVAAAAAAKQQVPQTRVARPSSKTEMVEAPAARRPAAAPAPEKKGVSKGVLVGGIAVPVIGALAWVLSTQLGGNGGATTDPGAGTSPPAAADSTAIPPTTPQPAPQTTPTTPQKTPTNGRTTTPTNTSSSTSDGTQRPPADPPPTTVAPMTRLQEWFQELNRADVTPARATEIVGLVESLRPGLTGLTLAESHFVEMTAYTVLENGTGACRAAREVKRLHTTASRLQQADVVIENLCS